MKFIAEETALTIQLEGWEILFGLRRRIVLPRSTVTSVEWYPEHTFRDRIWRVFGTGLPGVLYAGQFRSHGAPLFLYVHEPKGWSWSGSAVTSKNTLVISTQEYYYQRLLITCNPDVGAGIVNWWRGTSFPK